MKRLLRSLRPTQRQIHAASGRVMIDLSRWTLVERHGDLGPERGLHFHRDFGREKTKRTVDVRAKLSSRLGDFADFCETPNLKAARVGEHRALPADEVVQAAAGFDHFNAGPQPKVIRVAQDYPGVEVGCFQFFEANPLHRAGSPNRHEDWRLY